MITWDLIMEVRIDTALRVGFRAARFNFRRIFVAIASQVNPVNRTLDSITSRRARVWFLSLLTNGFAAARQPDGINSRYDRLARGALVITRCRTIGILETFKTSTLRTTFMHVGETTSGSIRCECIVQLGTQLFTSSPGRDGSLPATWRFCVGGVCQRRSAMCNVIMWSERERKRKKGRGKVFMKFADECNMRDTCIHLTQSSLCLWCACW